MARRQSGVALIDNRRRVSGNAAAPAVTYRLFPTTSGPASVISYSGIFGPGVTFAVTTGCNLLGYSLWVPNNGDTFATEFCLYHMTAHAVGTVISGSTVTSSTRTLGAWNDTLLLPKLALTAGVVYCATTAYSTTKGFAGTDNSFGAGQTYSAGIQNGPLNAYSDTGGTDPCPLSGQPQMTFQVASTDPTAQVPNQGSNSINLWIDVIVD